MDPEAELEAQLAGVRGAARVAPLLRLAQLRSNRYVRMPAGSAAAGAALEQAIGSLTEAADLLPPDDPGRLQVDVSLGWMLSTRYSGHGGSATDRDTAIDLLSGSVETATLPSVQQQGAFLILGQLSALRALHMDPGAPLDPMKQSMSWMSTGLSERSRADLDRAHDYLTRVVAAGPVNEQVRQAAEAMLQMVTMMREMFGGIGQGNMMANFTHLMGMMSRMGSGPAPSFPGAGVPVGMPTIVEGTVIPKQAAPVEPPARPASGGRREELLRQLATWAGAGTGEVASVARAVLCPSTPVVSWAEADEAVAAATVVGDGVLLAVTLWLRARADDGGGWDGDPGASADADRVAGLAALLDALSALPPGDPLVAVADAVPAWGPIRTIVERRAAVAGALRSHGIDALVWVHPVDDGHLCTLIAGRDATVSVGGITPAPGPAGGTGWAERARPVLAPVLAPDRRRIVLIAPGDLPWATAVASDDVVLWTAGSLDRLLRSTGRLPEIDANAVFVANPAGDRDQATVEAMVLRRMLYPRSIGLGNTVEQVDGRGTPDDVLAHLPGASLLHLGCAVRTTAPAALGLATGTGPAWLDLRRVTAEGDGLVVLPADAGADPASLLTVADALLDAGMSGVVHWLRPVPPAVASLMLYRLHEFLVDDRMSPPDAVAAVQRWMRDPDRPPSRCAPTAPGTDLTDPALWGALAFRA